MYVADNKSIDLSTPEQVTEFRRLTQRAITAKNASFTVQGLEVNTEHAQYLLGFVSKAAR